MKKPATTAVKIDELIASRWSPRALGLHRLAINSSILTAVVAGFFIKLPYAFL